MAFENDWLMKQMTGSAHMIGKIFQLEISHLDLELVEDQEGRLIKGEDYLDALIADEQFDEAILLVKCFMPVFLKWSARQQTYGFMANLKACSLSSCLAILALLI